MACRQLAGHGRGRAQRQEARLDDRTTPPPPEVKREAGLAGSLAGTWIDVHEHRTGAPGLMDIRAAARGNLLPSAPLIHHLPADSPPWHRSRGRAAMPATTPITSPGAEGGGGWPMHATAQPWHAEGRPLPTGALRRLLSPRARRGTPPAARLGGCRGSSPGLFLRPAPYQGAPCAPGRRLPAP